MLEVIEGNLPLPRIVKPFEAGLQATTATANPTVVNNVETLSHVPAILTHGAEWFRAAGTEASPGTMVFTVVGDVESPGVYELGLGTRCARCWRTSPARRRSRRSTAGSRTP
jgi:NADH-quinone oxidoreductase subunit F